MLEEEESVNAIRQLTEQFDEVRIIFIANIRIYYGNPNFNQTGLLKRWPMKTK